MPNVVYSVPALQPQTFAANTEPVQHFLFHLQNKSGKNHRVQK